LNRLDCSQLMRVPDGLAMVPVQQGEGQPEDTPPVRPSQWISQGEEQREETPQVRHSQVRGAPYSSPADRGCWDKYFEDMGVPSVYDVSESEYESDSGSDAADGKEGDSAGGPGAKGAAGEASPRAPSEGSSAGGHHERSPPSGKDDGREGKRRRLD